MRVLATVLAALAVSACFAPVGSEDSDAGRLSRDGQVVADANVLADAEVPADASHPDAAFTPDASHPIDAGPPPADAGMCGDPDKLARFHDCNTARDEASCQAAGGWWETGPFGEIFCECATGQEACPCRSERDCLGWCMVDSSLACSEESPAHCSQLQHLFGCVCVYHYGFTELCID